MASAAMDAEGDGVRLRRLAHDRNSSATYELRNLTDRPLALELVLAIRPSQVNPPTQFLNAPSGVAPISDIAWNDRALTVNGERTLFPLRAPGKVAAFDFDSGPLVKLLSHADWRAGHVVHDPFGYASAALGYPVTLAPRGSTTVAVTMPLSGAGDAPRARQSHAGRVDRARAGPHGCIVATRAERRRADGACCGPTARRHACAPRSRIS